VFLASKRPSAKAEPTGSGERAVMDFIKSIAIARELATSL
jgi:hypothetical protein